MTLGQVMALSCDGESLLDNVAVIIPWGVEPH